MKITNIRLGFCYQINIFLLISFSLCLITWKTIFKKSQPNASILNVYFVSKNWIKLSLSPNKYTKDRLKQNKYTTFKEDSHIVWSIRAKKKEQQILKVRLIFKFAKKYIVRLALWGIYLTEGKIKEFFYKSSSFFLLCTWGF